MRFSHRLLLIAILFFLVLGISIAQQEPNGDQGSGTGETGIFSGSITSGGENYSTGSVGTGLEEQKIIDSGVNVGIFGRTGLSTILESIIIPDIVTINSSTLPDLIISEVFFDGNDERLEISNLGLYDFSGNLTLTGIGINATINSFIGSEQSIVVARSGRTFGYFLDQSVIRNYVSMGFTDTKQIGVSLLYSGTLLDNFAVETGVVCHYNDKLTSLEKIKVGGEYLITGTSTTRIRNVQSGYLANPGKLYELLSETPPVSSNQTGSIPSIKITEVYLDSDQWLELTNVGSGFFSGNLGISGAKISLLTVAVSLAPGQSKVYGNSCNQILDAVVIGKTGLNLTISQSKTLSLDLLYSGTILDSFVVDSGYVKKYKDYNISFEKVGTSDSWITTKTTMDRRYNNATGYVINPGKIYTTGENLVDVSIPEPEITVYTGSMPINCADFTQKYEAEISEVFAGNEVYRPYIEISVGENLAYDSLFLSGSALLEPIEILLDQDVISKEKNTIFLISDSDKWYDEGIDSLSNPSLSLQNNGGRLLLYGGSGQDRQLLDIVYLTGITTGSSLYYNAHDRNCAKVLDETGTFSPGFERKFLQYFSVSTEPKIEYIKVGDAVAGTCPICPGISITGEDDTGEAEIQPSVISTGSFDVRIITIDYDPPGSDIGNEKITLLATLPSGGNSIILSKPNRYLKIGTTKRYLSGLLSDNVPLTLQGTFGFPNSSKSGNSITVQLRYQDELLDTYSYSFPLPVPKPAKIKTNVLTGTFLVTSVIDGDTIKILYSGSEQSIRFLGIDAPETTLLKNKKLGCFGEEAKAYLTSLLLGKEVHLEFDPTQQKTDSYKRRLNYVYLDGELINETMLANGYAKEYTFKVPYQMRDQFLSAQQDAQDGQLGLRDPSICPENALKTGEQLSGIILDALSGLSAKITYVLPNPKGKDDKEEIGIKIDALVVESGGFAFEPTATGVDDGKFISGFYLEINGKKKSIKTGLEIGKENILSGSLGLLNKAACVAFGYSGIILDNLCYAQPQEGQKIFADGSQVFQVTDQEQEVLDTLSFKTKGNQLCMMLGEMEVDCRNIPSGKTALKTTNENKLYEKFISLVESYLKDQWKDLYYNSDIQTYFTFLRADKKTIKAGIPDVVTSHGNVAAYDLQSQIHILETYSLAYRATRFGMVLLGEVTSP